MNLNNILARASVTINFFVYCIFTIYIYIIVTGGIYDMILRDDKTKQYFVTTSNIFFTSGVFAIWCIYTYFIFKNIFKSFSVNRK